MCKKGFACPGLRKFKSTLELKLQWDQLPLETKVPCMAWLLRFSLAVWAGPSSWWEGYLSEQLIAFCWLSHSSVGSPPKTAVLGAGRSCERVAELRWEPCPCSVTSINVCEARLALCLAFSCLKVPSEPMSGCEPTEDMHEYTKLLPTVCSDVQTDSSQSALTT